MNALRIVGMAALGIGFVLVVIGLNSAPAANSRESNTLIAMFAQPMTRFIVGGGAVGILGVLMVRVQNGKQDN